MVKISVCAESFFTNLPFEERVRKIADIGYRYIEFWHPEGTFDGSNIDFSQAKNVIKLNEVKKETGVIYNDFAFGAWDGSIGGNASNSEDHKEWLSHGKEMLNFAKKIDCSKGIILSGLTQDNLTLSQISDNLITAFGSAAQMAEEAGVVLVIEPLNSLVDHSGYYLDKTDEAVRIIREINSPNLQLLYDVYHMQIMEGNILDFIEKNIDIIGHFHSAGVPGRAELFDTEVNYPIILKKLDELKYSGCFGLEYFPKLPDEESLKRTLEYLET